MSLIEHISERLRTAPGYALIETRLAAGEDVSLAAPGVVRPVLVAALFAADPAPTLLVIPGEEAAERFARQLCAYLSPEAVIRLPMRGSAPWERHAHDVETVGRRARALHALDRGDPAIVVASGRALLRTIPPHGSQAFDPVRVALGDEIDLGETAASLARMGYERVERAEERGQFAVRGGTLDVFPADGAYPVRAELLGDQVETLRRYVSSTGQSIGETGATDLFPAREVRLSARAVRAAEAALAVQASTDDALAHDLEMMREYVYFNGIEAYLPTFYRTPGRVTDYLGPDARVFVVEPRAVFDDLSRAREEVEAAAKRVWTSLDGLYLSPAEVDLGGRRRLTIVSLLRRGAGVDAEVAARRPDVAGGEERLLSGVRALAETGAALVFAARDERMRARVTDLLTIGGVPVGSLDAGTRSGLVAIAIADIPAGYVVADAALAVVTADDAFPRARRAAGRGNTDADISFDYKPGDYVVHTTHGVALFSQVVRKTVLGVERDYLLLEYAGGDRLYVPLEQLDRVGKYVGADSSAPRLTRLDTTDWSRALSRTRRAVKQLAFDLVELYARRATAQGFAHGADTPWQAEMEATFPFEETPDQIAAIDAVKADMESPRPMDRLVAGDVGYGKTEVAVRAAFKAVQAGKQVMLLCPTTVLAQQHFTTFSERFDPYGARVEVLSRFRTKSQQREALEGFGTGAVDVLVGTHRLLSADVVPRDLGLVIIDEEQRFGVGQKEHFTHLREQIDVLTLSATPIPRTLRMALSGVRDLTVIDTPPPDRFPVGVHVGEWDEDLAQAAIRAEMERGGQVYYVHNRVKDIDDVVERLRELVPEVRIGVAHGQMTERALERVMEAFAAGEHDVLVSTTIVESGLDNPHTNTLLIDDSQRLGLAQLYQLKGRVGRSHVRAHAYFFFPRGTVLTEPAYERLVAVGEHAELGSGIKIAMRDLEIRGAGSLLGAEQHGNVSAVGFELFAHMLREAVAEARGEAPAAHPDVRVDLPLPAFLPEEYVPAVDERVRWYRRLAGARTPEALEQGIEELIAAYGAPPAAAHNLIEMVRARQVAAGLGVGSVSLVRGRLVLQPLEVGSVARGALSARLRAVYTEKGGRLAVPMPEEPDVARAAVEVLRLVAEELGGLGSAGATR